MKPLSIKNLFVALTVATFFLGHPVQSSADEATVLWTEGDVQIQPSGSETPTAAAPGAAVPEGSRIMTVENASCAIGFQGSLAESAVTLKPSTSAQIKSLGDSAQIGLEQGSLFVKLAKLKKTSQFTVTTPTAIASARGTGWFQSLDQVEVYEGTVSLKNTAGQEEDLIEGEAYDLGLEGSFDAKHEASAANRSAWETLYQRAVSSPYFVRISADDILRIRETIDAKRKSAACGSADAYSWKTTVAPGQTIASAQINELKTALAELPFAQTEDFVKNYLDPVPVLQSGDPVRASVLRLLSDAADKASC